MLIYSPEMKKYIPDKKYLFLSTLGWTRLVYLDVVTGRCSVKKMFLEISTGTGVFPWIFSKFLRTTFLTEHLRWMLLFILRTQTVN